jgi:hypothetical protein
VRDTDIVLRVLSRLLTAPVLPLDYEPYAEALLAELEPLADTLAGTLEIAPLLSGASALRQQARAFNERAAAVAAAETSEARRLDRALMRASRALVPINYTTGERFHHDPALPQAPWPAIDGLRDLAAAQRLGAGDLPFRVVHARRTRNRIMFALREATQALAEAAA